MKELDPKLPDDEIRGFFKKMVNDIRNKIKELEDKIKDLSEFKTNDKSNNSNINYNKLIQDKDKEISDLQEL